MFRTCLYAYRLVQYYNPQNQGSKKTPKVVLNTPNTHTVYIYIIHRILWCSMCDLWLSHALPPQLPWFFLGGPPFDPAEALPSRVSFRRWRPVPPDRRRKSDCRPPGADFWYPKTWAVLGWLPSGKLTLLWKITIFRGKTRYKWPFSIAMLNYQRVTGIKPKKHGGYWKNIDDFMVISKGSQQKWYIDGKYHPVNSHRLWKMAL